MAGLGESVMAALKTTLPFARTGTAWGTLLLAVFFGALGTQGAPPPKALPVREPDLGTRVLQFFRGIGEPDEPRSRRQLAPPPPDSEDLPPSSLDQPPRRTFDSRTSGGYSTRKKSTRSKLSESSQEPTSSSAANDDAKPASKLDATKQQLADLKRKVAAMEEELARAEESKHAANASSSGSGTSDSKLPEERELILTAPAPNVPPRPVASTPMQEPKRSFATEAQVTPSVPKPGASTSAGAASKTTAKGGGNQHGSAAPDVSGPSEEIPAAEKTDKAGLVRSPHPPHKEIDVSGLPSGSLAKDPISQKVFRVP
jgi:hypothetical protein